MENVVLVIHLILALVLIGVVLMQRSEGGGLGIGGGGGVMSNRSAATALAKLTWILAIGFICTSIALTIIAADKSAGVSVIDRLSDQSSTGTDAEPETPEAGGTLGTDLLPPSTDENAPIVPPAN